MSNDLTDKAQSHGQATSRPQKLAVRGLHFNVVDQGQGKPILLLHGFPDSLTIWEPITPYLLAAGYRVIAFDQRGFGDTDAPIGKIHYRIQQIVDDIPALLDQLDIHQPIQVMGHDWGSVIGWCLACFYPDRVQSLVAVSVGHPTCYGRAGLEQKISKGLYTLWFQFPKLTEWYLLRGGGFKRWLREQQDLSKVLPPMQRAGRLTAALNWYRANLLPILLSRWPRCSRPTLGVWSDQDPYLTEAQMCQSERYVDAEWRYLKIEQCGHWIPQEQPALLAKAAIDWFAEHQDNSHLGRSN
ncbi:alpha/beta fold hydrolase [Aestuariirhabdus sp. Z084]|uniref:alpha/beta fold hydrolase n=1 Tax=Aestuariirhabdus haliotis TaxID=2918751 RepID=UPI00201B42D1|nr:alpha/beta fold hydrolase [Aestuariirhabdus haliotis]MCL6417721.1 alpha/beta fold hydrolase [Aestuariirhabdus haliotis]MCL6421648.1 alpha/beta fold hydrolase [Aestuariirhabdus haliotis]